MSDFRYTNGESVLLAEAEPEIRRAVRYLVELPEEFRGFAIIERDPQGAAAQVEAKERPRRLMLDVRETPPDLDEAAVRVLAEVALAAIPEDTSLCAFPREASVEVVPLVMSVLRGAFGFLDSDRIVVRVEVPSDSTMLH